LTVRADLLLSNADGALAALDAVRQQYNLLALPLAAQVPVDLVVTQLDRIAGFAEITAGLPSTTGVLGVTLPPREGKASVQAAVRERLTAVDGVLDWTRQRCHALVARAEPGDGRQARLFGFWQQLDRLAERVATAAGRLAGVPLPGGDPLRVRGVYFTSAQPDPIAPADEWMAALAQSVGGSLPPVDVGITVAPAFTTALFTEELPRDGQYADRLRALHRRHYTFAATAALTAVALTTISIRGMTSSAQANLDLMQRTLDSASAVSTRTDQPQVSALAALDVLRSAALIWREPAPEGFGWGLFRGDELATATAQAFTGAVCRGVFAPGAERSAQPLRQFVARYGGGGLASGREYQRIFDHLRQYLLLSDVPESLEPHLWSSDRELWRDQLLATWKDLDNGSEDTRRATILQAHLQLVHASAATPIPGDDVCARSGGGRAVIRDAQLVAGVREILQRTPQNRAIVDKLITEIDRSNLPGVHLQELTNATRIHGDQDLSPSFTRPGWVAFQRALADLRQRGGGEDWVLADYTAGASYQERCEALRHLYAERYIQAWLAFFERLRLDSPGSWQEAVAITTDLTQHEPLRDVFRAINDNTQKLPPISCSEAQALLPRVLVPAPPLNPNARNSTDVAARFARLVAFAIPPSAPGGQSTARLASYQLLLVGLRAASEKAKGNPTNEAQSAGEVATSARSTLHELVQGANLGGDWDARVEHLLAPPIDGVGILARGEIVRITNEEWCAAVVRPIEQTTAGLYPFAPSARMDARLDDIKHLFHPQTGSIAKFRLDKLGAYVDERGNNIETRNNGSDAPLHINRSVVDLLDAAHKLGLLLHRDAEIGVDMDILMACERTIAKVILTVDELEHLYLCTKDPSRQIHWPGKAADKRRALLDAMGESGRNDRKSNLGDFGLFRMLEDGQPRRRPGQDSFAVIYDFKRFNLGNLDMVVTPAKTRGGDVFHGFGPDERFLSPFRAHGFVSPPHSLFAEVGFTCAP
jgi:type VI secretion system protein ImpL